MHLRRRRNVSSDFGNLTWMVAASTLTGLRSSGGILSTTLSLESVPIGCRNIPYPGPEGFLFSARGHVSKQVKVFEAGDSALISSSSGAWMTTHRESPPHAEFYLTCQAPQGIAYRGPLQNAHRIIKSLCNAVREHCPFTHINQFPLSIAHAAEVDPDAA